MSLIKNQLKMEKDIEIQRECLFSHENFSAIDTFKLFDKDSKGYINEQDLKDFEATYDIEFLSPELVLRIFDRDGDGQLNFMEFTKSITPKNVSYLSTSFKKY